jgi:hypothetical protein
MSASSSAVNASTHKSAFSTSMFKGFASSLARDGAASIFNQNIDKIRAFAQFIIQNPKAIDSMGKNLKSKLILELSSALFGRDSSNINTKLNRATNSRCSNPNCEIIKKQMSQSLHNRKIGCKCHKVIYCSPECRTLHWESHKRNCRPILIV